MFQEELTVQACVIYHHILMYMGDVPGRRTRLGMELTDVIVDGPLKHVSINILYFKSEGRSQLLTNNFSESHFTSNLPIVNQI